MDKALASITTAKGTRAQEMDMRDIMGNMEELANMINIHSTSSACEIIAIEPPCIWDHPSPAHLQGPDNGYPIPANSRILPFPKK